MKKTTSSKRTGRKKRRRIRRLYLFVTTFLLALGIVFTVHLITWVVQLDTTERDMDARIRELTRQRNDLIAQNESYHREIELLNTPAYIEQLARDKLGLVRRGEIPIEPKKGNY